MTVSVVAVVLVVAVDDVGGGLAVRPICPRISPLGFRAVWTLTYAPPPGNAATDLAFAFAVPEAPDGQGPHNATTTGPARPRPPRWMCAAAARPLSPAKASRQESVAGLPPRTSRPVKLPRA